MSSALIIDLIKDPLALLWWNFGSRWDTLSWIDQEEDEESTMTFLSLVFQAES